MSSKKNLKNAFDLLQQPKPTFKCPYCKENGIFIRFDTQKKLSMHINHIHANDPIPDLYGDSPVDSKPKFKSRKLEYI